MPYQFDNLLEYKSNPHVNVLADLGHGNREKIIPRLQERNDIACGMCTAHDYTHKHQTFCSMSCGTK